ncbi:MAG: putative membrane protein [Candidatus Methanohalarchaeum thermophilum]|uniref:Membrane protein n=1 Tax=Methanohalarchaeum thermophilum TaxID=1903181 RepID=A0A1Q6DSM3_METT1|nr:MAG: putative membrane protein [Candidatus Methanohalarchaeum thermophilum]
MKNTNQKLFLVFLVFICLFLFTTGSATAFEDGSGTETDPYEIGNWTHLDDVRNELGANYTLVNDINKTTDGYDDLVNTTDGWNPIDSFTGTFDGNGYEISDLYINRPETHDDVGLFEQIEDGSKVTDVGLVDINVTADNGYVGGLIGYCYGDVSDSYSTGEVNGSSFAGGLIGYAYQSNVTDSYSDANVEGDTYVGGLIGEIDDGNVKNSYSTGNVIGNADDVGGLVGNAWKSKVSNSYSTSDVEGTGNNVGGLIGYSDTGSSVSDSYATGDVNGTGEEIGGLIGWNDMADVSNCSSTGNVTGKDAEVGGLIGGNYGGNVVDSHSDGDVTGIGMDVGGLIGLNEGDVSNSSSTGDVEGQGDYVGGLIGGNEADVSNCSSTGDVNGSGDYVGGLIGWSDGGVSDSYSDGEVEGVSEVGGLIGNLEDSNINSSYSTGNVIGNMGYVGGLVGYLEESTGNSNINNSYSTGEVIGNETSEYGFGGLVGWSHGNINNSYATGDVTGNDDVGGLIGGNNGDVSNSYATGNVTGNSEIGGLIGWSDGVVSDSYWDNQTTTQTEGIGIQDGTVNNVVGLLTANMTGDSAKTNMSAFDFQNTWETVSISDPDTTDDGYPILQVLNRGDQLLSQGIMVFADGTGTKNDPYQIENLNQLNQTRNNLTAHYELISDIDASDTSTWNGGVGFDPIGDGPRDWDISFNGTFDGNGYTIANLTIDRSGGSFVGLFGLVGSGGTIKNIGIEDVTVHGKEWVGSVVGENYGTVNETYATGSVTGVFQDVGGLVGWNDGVVNNSYATTNVTGPPESSTAQNSGTGGLVGENAENGEITNSYAAGNVSDSYDDVGGLAGQNKNTVIDSYWDNQTTTQNNGIGDDTGSTTNVVGLPTANMTGDSALYNMSAFDFQYTWETVSLSDGDADSDGYPILQSLNRETQIEAQPDNTAPTIQSFGFTNNDPTNNDQLEIEIETDEELGSDDGDIEVSISGSGTGTLTGNDFTESGSGPYLYTATYDASGDSDGDFTATLNTAQDSAGNDGANTESDTVTLDTSAPSDVSVDNAPIITQSGESVDFDVSFIESDPSSVDIQIGSQSTQTFSVSSDGSHTLTVDAGNVPDSEGSYDINVNVFDDAGNTGNTTNTLEIYQYDGVIESVNVSDEYYGQVSVAISDLGTSIDIDSVPEISNIYQYIEINLTLSDTATVDPGDVSANITFTVNKTWLEGVGADSENIVLKRYNNEEWNELRTEKIGENTTHIKYKAQTPGFSYFAIGTTSTSDKIIGGTILNTNLLDIWLPHIGLLALISLLGVVMVYSGWRLWSKD